MMETNEYSREQIISALLFFDEGSRGDCLDYVATDELWERLSEVADEKGYFASDLIDINENGL